MTNKLSPRNYEARIVGYTSSHGTYWVRKDSGSYHLAKSPTSISDETSSESEEGGLDEEIPLGTQKEHDALLPDSPIPDEPPAPIPPETLAPKKKRGNKNWLALVGTREKSSGRQ